MNLQSLVMLSFFILFSFSCSLRMNRKVVEHNPPSIPLESVTQAEEVEENNHKLIEVAQSDEEIQRVTGGDPNLEEEKDITDEPILKKNSHFLKIKKTKRVKYWIQYFTQVEKSRFQRFLNNGEKYRPIIEKILEEEGVPKELFYVGLIESGYYLGAKSSAKATGPWQFIKGTARRYNLRINHEIDERRDIEKATRAAARYFRDLYNLFDNWELALASYNAGEFGMMRRIKKYRMNDYYELSKAKKIPSETINYVPKVLAAMYAVENAKLYGLNLPQENAKMWSYTKKVKAPKATSLAVLSKKHRLSLSHLVALNPELNFKKTPRYYQGQYYLRIPSKDLGTEIFVADLPLKSHNFKKVKTKAKPRRTKHTKISKAKKTKAPALHYYVQRGDNLTDIGRWFKISPNQIKKANKLSSTKIKIGQRLTIPKRTRETYTVKKGDYLNKVAQKFNLSPTVIIKINKLKTDSLRRGQKLIVFNL